MCVRWFFAIGGEKNDERAPVDDRRPANGPWSVRGHKILFVGRSNGDAKTWLACIAHSPLGQPRETTASTGIVRVYLAHSLITSERDLRQHW